MLHEVSPDIDMVLHIRDPEADRLRREPGRTAFPRLRDEIMALSRRTAALPRRTGRTADEILGYDERSLPR
jgi:antitoxin VapB